MVDYKVSVIVPIYNVEKYLDHCVNSILLQSYKNIECILVDDGSTDSSGTKCDYFLTSDDRVKVIHKRNGGLSSARNAGLDIASGDFVLFVDSDDYIGHNVISDALTAFEKSKDTNIGIVQFPVIWTEEDCNEYSITGKDNKCTKFEFTAQEAIKKTFDKSLEIRLQFSAVWDKLYRKDIFGKDLRFAEGKIFEDTLIMHHLYIRSENILNVESADAYYYRIRSGSIAHSKFSPRVLDIIDGFQDRLDTVIKMEYQNCIALACEEYYRSIMSNWCLARDVKAENQVVLCQLYDRFKMSLEKYDISGMSVKMRGMVLLFRINPTLYYNLKNAFYCFRRKK